VSHQDILKLWTKGQSTGPRRYPEFMENSMLPSPPLQYLGISINGWERVVDKQLLSKRGISFSHAPDEIVTLL